MGDELRRLSSRIVDAPLVAALPAKSRIIGALIMREAMSRFGRENLGFFWLMAEPLLLTLGVMVAWSILRHNSNTDAIGIVPFVLTGYTMLTLWRHSVTRAVHAFRNNAGLLFHRQIYYLDIIVARVLLDMISIGTAFFVAYVPFYLFEIIEPIYDPLALIVAWLLMGWLCFGLALIIAALTEMIDPLAHFVQPVMYLLLPISGAFFLVEWLPLKVQKIALILPIVHLMEMFRFGLFGNRTITHWDVAYVVACCIFLTTAGLLLAQAARTRIRFE
ncbi:ABC transporter permease [Pseudorhodoplanes sp.]|uniref:ABC transporter permease n=1 Tax=Pseudorhodoplanes sp. TaxID=1934341 RepID=UPI003D102BE0